MNCRAARLSNDQFSVKQDFARRKVRRMNTIEHGAKGRFANFMRRLMNRSKRHGQQAGIGYVINANQTHILRNSNVSAQKQMHQLSGHAVIHTDKGFDVCNCASRSPF